MRQHLQLQDKGMKKKLGGVLQGDFSFHQSSSSGHCNSCGTGLSLVEAGLWPYISRLNLVPPFIFACLEQEEIVGKSIATMGTHQ